MAEVYKRLAGATVGTTKTTIYTVPALTSTILKHMRIVSLLTTSQTITIWHNSGSTELRLLRDAPIDGNGFAEWDGTLTLSAGDTISVQANIALAFEFQMYGIEVS